MATTQTRSGFARIEELLGDEADALLSTAARRSRATDLHLPGPDFVDRVWRRLRPLDPTCCATCRSLFDHGRLGGTGLRLHPARRSGHRALGGRVVRAEPRLLRSGEHRRSSRSRAAATPSPRRSACSASVAAQVRAQDPVHPQAQPQRVPVVSRTTTTRSSSPSSSRRATWARSASARRSTSAPRSRSARSQEVAAGLPGGARARAWSPSCGATCATPRSRRTARTTTPSADLTGQANHLGVTIEADIIKQKLPEQRRRASQTLKFGKTHHARLLEADDATTRST